MIAITHNGSRLGEVGDLKEQSLKLVTNFNKHNK
jgi:hypothetical protein